MPVYKSVRIAIGVVGPITRRAVRRSALHLYRCLDRLVVELRRHRGIVGHLATIGEHMRTGRDKAFGGRSGGKECLAVHPTPGSFISHPSPGIDDQFAVNT